MSKYLIYEWRDAMCKILFHTDFPLYNLKKGREYLVVNESDDYYFVEVDGNVVQMIHKDIKNVLYEVFE